MKPLTVMLLKALEVKGMQQKDLVDRSGLSKTHISQVIGGSRRLTISAAQDISLALGIVSARELLIAQLDGELAILFHMKS